MKKKIELLVTGILTATVFAAAVPAGADDFVGYIHVVHSEDSVEISVSTDSIGTDSVPIIFPDAKPFIDENDRTQIPVRAVSEALGANVSWNDEDKTVTIDKNGTTVSLTIGSDIIKVNGADTTMDTAAVIIGDRTYIPLRFVTEALDYFVVSYTDTEYGTYLDGVASPPSQETVDKVYARIEEEHAHRRGFDMYSGSEIPAELLEKFENVDYDTESELVNLNEKGLRDVITAPSDDSAGFYPETRRVTGAKDVYVRLTPNEKNSFCDMRCLFYEHTTVEGGVRYSDAVFMDPTEVVVLHFKDVDPSYECDMLLFPTWDSAQTFTVDIVGETAVEPETVISE